MKRIPCALVTVALVLTCFSTSQAVPPKSKTSLRCDEDTKIIFNRCGIEVLPFVRTVFFDIDNDGALEMVAGSKDGTLRLYRNQGTNSDPSWHLVENYFNGIRAGAFSAPAAGDLDNDGRPEILLGTGGFSSDSGKVLFFRNAGSGARPSWEKIHVPEIAVGNDATPALFDIDDDGRLDLVVGNSTGNLTLFRNRSAGSSLSFEKDPGYFGRMKLGMYVVPAVASSGDRPVIIAGNDMGKIFILENTGGRNWDKSPLKISAKNFASPAFMETGDPKKKDLVISDGSGRLSHYKNTKGTYREWESSTDFFNGRVLAGPVCTPAVSDIRNRSFMVVGNINGEIKLFEHMPSSTGLPWVERQGFFSRIKLPGFSRGILTTWQGKHLLITGQQNGIIRAFLNAGTLEKPSWAEQKKFFRTLPKMLHAAPAVFDIDGDGKWELIVGDAGGLISGFRYRLDKKKNIVWEKLEESFSRVKVERFATPALFRDDEKLYLFSGQQDGRINVFAAEASKQPVFDKEDYLGGIQVNNHSSPSVVSRNGIIEISVGDYNGNLKHFACRKTGL